MEEEIIGCIPSSSLRKYLRTHSIRLSVMQKATIVNAYAKRRRKISLFRKLAGMAESEAEKLLLNTAIRDFEQNFGDEYMKATCEVYSKNFPHDGFPIFPFLEVCNLPVLFEPGDVIRGVRGGNLYCVGSGPALMEGLCDFSDECYLCYPVSCRVRSLDDLSLSHVHINICEADGASADMLTRSQRKNLRRIINIIIPKNYEPGKFPPLMAITQC